MNKKDLLIFSHIAKAKKDLSALYMTDMDGVPVAQEDSKQPKLNYDPDEPKDQTQMLAFFAIILRIFGVGAASQEECIRQVLEQKAGRDWVRQLIRAMDGLIRARESKNPRSISVALKAIEVLFSTSDLSEQNAINKFPCLREYANNEEFRRKIIRALGDRLRDQRGENSAFIEAVSQAFGDSIAYDPEGLGLLVAVYKRLSALDPKNEEYAGTYIVATALLAAREKEFYDDLSSLLNGAQAVLAIGAIIVSLGTGVGEIAATIYAIVRAAQSIGQLLQDLASRGYFPSFGM